MVYATKEKYNAYMKEYYKNKPKEIILCTCGTKVKKLSLKSHLKTKKHEEYLKMEIK